ncbi:hypothetical protein BDW68DRAFT_157600 [Aspergillus falconensis]
MWCLVAVVSDHGTSYSGWYAGTYRPRQVGRRSGARALARRYNAEWCIQRIYRVRRRKAYHMDANLLLDHVIELKVVGGLIGGFRLPLRRVTVTPTLDDISARADSVAAMGSETVDRYGVADQCCTLTKRKPGLAETGRRTEYVPRLLHI